MLIAGGGRVAERKITSLLSTEAVVLVVAPEVTPHIAHLAESGAIKLKSACYESVDLAGVFLAVAATCNSEVNRQIADDARRLGILVSVSDEPDSGNCSFPAMLRRGALEIGVSTQGSCPAFAAEIRDLLATIIGDEFGTMLERLAAEREKLLTEGTPSTYNGMVLRSRARELIDEFLNHEERVP